MALCSLPGGPVAGFNGNSESNFSGEPFSQFLSHRAFFNPISWT